MKIIATPTRLNHTYFVRFRYSRISPWISAKREYRTGLVLTGAALGSEASTGEAVAEAVSVGPEPGAVFSDFAESAFAIVPRNE
jgi:hypothetical protein